MPIYRAITKNISESTCGKSRALSVQQYYTHSRELLATAGMNLRQWTTNSKVLKQKVKGNNSGAPDTYLLLAECEVRTASYGPSFFPSFYGPSAKRAGHVNKEGKNEDP